MFSGIIKLSKGGLIIVGSISKEYYRTSLNYYKQYIKLSQFANEVGISKSALSMFMKDTKFDYQISLTKLELLDNNIKSFCKSVCN